MENLSNNPNLSAHIGHKILHFLDVKSLQNFRFVNLSMKKMVDNPKFWLQKLKKKGLPKEILMQWRNLFDLVDENLMENLTKCLMKLNFNFSGREWYWFQDPPIFIGNTVQKFKKRIICSFSVPQRLILTRSPQISDKNNSETRELKGLIKITYGIVASSLFKRAGNSN